MMSNLEYNATHHLMLQHLRCQYGSLSYNTHQQPSKQDTKSIHITSRDNIPNHIFAVKMIITHTHMTNIIHRMTYNSNHSTNINWSFTLYEDMKHVKSITHNIQSRISSLCTSWHRFQCLVLKSLWTIAYFAKSSKQDVSMKHRLVCIIHNLTHISVHNTK